MDTDAIYWSAFGVGVFSCLRVMEVTSRCKQPPRNMRKAHRGPVVAIFTLLAIALGSTVIKIWPKDYFWVERKHARMPVWVRGKTASGTFIACCCLERILVAQAFRGHCATFAGQRSDLCSCAWQLQAALVLRAWWSLDSAWGSHIALCHNASRSESSTS